MKHALARAILWVDRKTGLQAVTLWAAQIVVERRIEQARTNGTYPAI